MNEIFSMGRIHETSHKSYLPAYTTEVIFHHFQTAKRNNSTGFPVLS
jgi:hypothetical protein